MRNRPGKEQRQSTELARLVADYRSTEARALAQKILEEQRRKELERKHASS